MKVYELREALDRLVQGNPSIDDLNVEVIETKHDAPHRGSEIQTVEYHPFVGTVLLTLEDIA